MPELPLDPNLDHLRERAEALLSELQELRPQASLADAQAEIAHRHGYAGWNDLVDEVERLPRTREALLERVATAHEQFRRTVAGLRKPEFDLRTSSGWTVKGMLAHVAFWEETVAPGVNAMLRERPWVGRDLLRRRLEADHDYESDPYWHGGDAWIVPLGRDDWHGGDPWEENVPFLEVDHNAREAAWGEARTYTEVLERLDRAHAQLIGMVGSFTDEESGDLRFVRAVAVQTWRHYPEHLDEMDAVAARRSDGKP
jgi:hypothetical protein